MTQLSRLKWGRDIAHDSRDRQYKLRRRRRYHERVKRFWRLGARTDQGETAACVGHAWYGWFAASPVRQRPIEPFGIYTLAQNFDEWEGTDYDGTSIRAGAKVLQITGHVGEYDWAWDVESALEHLLYVGPLVFGAWWYEGMIEPDKKNFIHASGRDLGGHAVLVYGASVPQKYVSICNSWGKTWGKNGTAKLSFEDFGMLLDDDGECCTAQELQVK